MMNKSYLSKATCIITSIVMMLGLICIIPSMKVSAENVGDTFTATNEAGINIKYEITTTTPGEVKVIANDPKYSGEITIPSLVNYDGQDYNVTSIGDGAFFLCENLKSVEIPNSVTSIGEWAFGGCCSLESVVIPDGVTSIEDGTFISCQRLKSIEIPNNITSIGQYAFLGCLQLTSIEIPNSVTSFGPSAFSNCRNLKSIEIPNSVTFIGKYAFENCCNITSIEIPNSVTFIGYCAFSWCSGLTSIEIPNSVTSIGERAFQNCYNVTSIEIPNSVTSIGDDAFKDTSFNNVYTDENVADIVLEKLSNTYYKISYDLNDKTTNDDFYNVQFVKDGELPVHLTITSGGFIARVWNTMPDGTGTDYDNTTEITENITLYAKWTGNSYNITYNLDGGTNHPSNTATYNYATGLTLQNPTKDGYNFDGWFDNAEFTGSAVTEISTTYIGDKTLYAKWTKIIDAQTPTYTPNPHNKTTTTEKIADIASDFEDGDNLTIKVTSNNKSINSEVLNEIKGRNIDVTIEVDDGIEWTFNGKDIPDDWNAKDINFNVDTENSNIPVDIINSKAGENKSILANLSYSGEFGFEMTLTVHIGYLDSGKTANLYYYNPETNELEFIESDQINGAGDAKFNFNHASDYVILVADEAEATSNNTDTTTTTDNSESNPMTGNSMPTALLITSLVAVVIVTKKKLVK